MLVIVEVIMLLMVLVLVLVLVVVVLVMVVIVAVMLKWPVVELLVAVVKTQASATTHEATLEVPSSEGKSLAVK